MYGGKFNFVANTPTVNKIIHHIEKRRKIKKITLEHVKYMKKPSSDVLSVLGFSCKYDIKLLT